MKLLLAALLAACGRSEPAAPEPPRVVADAAITRDITAGARELITAVADDWSSTDVTLRRYRRDAASVGKGATWKPVGALWPGVIGKSGMAWGSGLHGIGAPSGRTGPIKREGDGKSPAGVFALGAGYGYGAAPSGARIPYTKVDDAWKCVDDPGSRAYNQILDQRTTTVDWKSAEDMHRADALYTWVIDVGHNQRRTPEGGSCIFLHVWGGPGSSTVGCTAMAEPVLADLIATLDPSAVFVLLTRRDYTELSSIWQLPAI